MSLVRMGNSSSASSLCPPDQKETILARLRKLSQGSVSCYGNLLLDPRQP